MKKWLVVLLVIIVLFSLFSLAVTAVTIEEEVEDTLEEEQSVRVIVKLKPNAKAERIEARRSIAEQVKIGAMTLNRDELKQKRSFRSMNGFAAVITEAGLDKLRNNPAIESVV